MTETANKHREAPPKSGIRHVSPVRDLEIRQEGKNGSAIFSGYAVRWGDEAEIFDWLGSFTERFQPGAFVKTIAERGPEGNGQIKFFRHHGFETMTVAAKYLALEEDAVGLRFEVETIDTQVGRDLAVEVRAGVVDTVSLGFDAIREIWDSEEEDRTVLEARLWEISAINWPAYPDSTIDNVRAFERLPAYLDAVLNELRQGKTIADEDVTKLTEARGLIDEVIASADSADEPDDEPLDEEQDRELDVELALRERALNL